MSFFLGVFFGAMAWDIFKWCVKTIWEELK